MATPRSATRPDAAQLVIGIDGGGTKTVCQIATASPRFPATDGGDTTPGDLRVLGNARGGPSNPRAVGLDAACTVIDATVSAAFESAGLARETAAACVIGLAGAGNTSTQQAVTTWGKKQSVAARIRVVPDYELVLAAGTPTGIGVGLIAGTGSLSFGRNSRGETARAGGWGYLLGDDGSGFAIGRAAVRRVLSAADRGQPERPLHRLVRGHFSANSSADIIAAVYASGDPRAALAAVATPVAVAAEEGDPLAQEILGKAACELAELVAAVANRLQADEQPLPLALAGGILLGSKLLRETLRRALESSGAEAALVQAESLSENPKTPTPRPSPEDGGGGFRIRYEFAIVHEPVAGAVRLAIRDAK